MLFVCNKQTDHKELVLEEFNPQCFGFFFQQILVSATCAVASRRKEWKGMDSEEHLLRNCQLVVNYPWASTLWCLIEGGLGIVGGVVKIPKT